MQHTEVTNTSQLVCPWTNHTTLGAGLCNEKNCLRYDSARLPRSLPELCCSGDPISPLSSPMCNDDRALKPPVSPRPAPTHTEPMLHTSRSVQSRRFPLFVSRMGETSQHSETTGSARVLCRGKVCEPGRLLHIGCNPCDCVRGGNRAGRSGIFRDLNVCQAPAGASLGETGKSPTHTIQECLSTWIAIKQFR